MDVANPMVKAWEELMWKYQQALSSAKPQQQIFYTNFRYF